MDNIFKLHGMTTTIVSHKDMIFTSKFFQEVFKALKVSLRFSIAYHPKLMGKQNASINVLSLT